MAKYVYPAIFTPEEDGGFSIEFPDVKGCCTQGNDMADGIEMATDALCLMLYDMEERGKEIPKVSDIRAVSAATDSIVILIACDTLDYKHYFENKTVTKP